MVQELDQYARDYSTVEQELSKSAALAQLLPEAERGSTLLLFVTDEPVTLELAAGKHTANLVLTNGLLLIWSDTVTERINLTDYTLEDTAAGNSHQRSLCGSL